jgi:hypothetical protein
MDDRDGSDGGSFGSSLFKAANGIGNRLINR